MLLLYCDNMKNKGFTLVELMAVIVIIAILLGLSFGVYLEVSKNVLESQYNNLMEDVLTKASNYAEKLGTTEPIYISIDFLIKQGLLTPDDEDYLYDPRDHNNILNCYIIHVYLKDDEYVAELKDKAELEDGSCDENKININDIDILCNGQKCNNDWYNKDITLTIGGLSEDELINSEVEWSSLNGVYVKQNTSENKKLVVNPELILNTTYSVLIKYDGKEKRLSKNIKIDKEMPQLINNSLQVEYDKKQYLKVSATDMSGSGYKGFALNKNTCEGVSYQTDNLKIQENGDYKLCVSDNAGNVLEKNIKINKITFDYDDTSNTNITKKDIYFLDGDTNYPLLVPSRTGYNFKHWEKNNNKVYSFNDLKDNDIVKAKWDFSDLDIVVDKIDKNTVGVLIENKINMILVLDVSGSMDGSELSNLKTVSKNLIESMSFDVGSTISIIEFESSARILLEKGTNKNEALNIINGLSADGGTSFNNALNKAQTVIDRANFEKENTFMIFVSDGYDGSSLSTSIITDIKNKISTVYSIGIGSGADTSSLTTIASTGCYFNSNNGLESLKDIFTKIQDEIREETNIKSNQGLIHLPNLFVSNEFPFVLTVNGKDNTYTSLSSISDLVTIVNNEYYLDLKKVDNVYKLNGNLKVINFTYYYS